MCTHESRRRWLCCLFVVLLTLNPVLPFLHQPAPVHAQESGTRAASAAQNIPLWPEQVRAITRVVSSGAPVRVADSPQVASAGLVSDEEEKPGSQLQGTQSANSASIIRVVATTGTDTAGCGSAATPCQTVQFAVEQALAGDEIRIAAGTYVNPAPAAEGWFVLIGKSLTLAGGYSTANWDAADPVANPTVLDGENIGEIVCASIADTTLTLAGLTLTRGMGSGVRMSGARLLMSDCVLSNIAGSAVSLYDSDNSQILTSQIISNTGSGVSAYHSEDLVLSGNTIRGNGNDGLYLDYSGYATINNSTIISNTGWGIYLNYGSDYVSLEHNTISSNGEEGVFVRGSAYGGGNDYLSLVGNSILSNTGHGVQHPRHLQRLPRHLLGRQHPAQRPLTYRLW